MSQRGFENPSEHTNLNNPWRWVLDEHHRFGYDAWHDRGEGRIVTFTDRIDTPSVVRGVDATATWPGGRGARSLTYDFLTWLADGPRTYAEVMERWQTSCPRLSIWEDALDGGLVRVERDDRTDGHLIATLTTRGRAMLDGQP